MIRSGPVKGLVGPPSHIPPDRVANQRTVCRRMMQSQLPVVIRTSQGLQNNQPMNRREAIIAGAVGIATAVTAVENAQASPSENPEVEPIRALLKAHDEAFTDQDINGVLACFTKTAAIMGSGPGEIWSGPDEIKVAYEHFFQGFDKGQQKFEYQFRIGGLTSDMGWMMTSGNVTGKKDEKEGPEVHSLSPNQSHQLLGRLEQCDSPDVQRLDRDLDGLPQRASQAIQGWPRGLHQTLD
jgi:ketosteroid isomerase-like protein